MAAPPLPPHPMALAPGAYVLNGGPAPTPIQAQQTRDAIAAGTYVVPPARAAANGHQDAPGQALALAIPVQIRNAGTGARQEMLGVTMTDVMAAGYTALVIALEKNHYNAFLQDCILAVNMGPTVARNRVQQYAALAPTSMFREFEIQGRAADLTSPMGMHGQWVQGSPMHAGAVRLWGLALLAVAPQGGFLNRVAQRMGTILNPPAVPVAPAKLAERSQLLLEASQSLSPAERLMVQNLIPRFNKLLAVLDAIYGAAGGDLDAAITAAGLYVGFEL